MKMIVAYIRHDAFEPIRQDLLEKGFPSLTITEVKGSGRQKGITEHYRGADLTVHLRQQLRGTELVEDLRIFGADPVTGQRGQATNRLELEPTALVFSYEHQVLVEAG